MKETENKGGFYYEKLVSIFRKYDYGNNLEVWTMWIGGRVYWIVLHRNGLSKKLGLFLLFFFIFRKCYILYYENYVTYFTKERYFWSMKQKTKDYQEFTEVLKLCIERDTVLKIFLETWNYLWWILMTSVRKYLP